MDREELISVVNKIMNCEGTEKEIDDLLELLKKNVLDPEVSDYIFYGNYTAEEVVDKALSYKPIYL